MMAKSDSDSVCCGSYSVAAASTNIETPTVHGWGFSCPIARVAANTCGLRQPPELSVLGLTALPPGQSWLAEVDPRSAKSSELDLYKSMGYSRTKHAGGSHHRHSKGKTARSSERSRLQFVRNSKIISYMNKTTKTAQLIRQRVAAIPIGEPFTPTAFLECGTRASVDQTLSRLVKVGSIERVTRGVYVRSELSRFVGKVSPSPLKVAETVAKTSGAIVQVHGAEAARRLELTTQVPTQSVFVTSGPTKCIRVGKMEIRLQHVCQRKLTLAGRPAGLALAAMWYLGKKEVTPVLVEKIRRKLGSSEFEVLKSAAHSMPAWMSDAIFRNGRKAVHA